MIQLCNAGGWNVTNLGAILFAKRLDDWPALRRKAIRVIQYRGTGRTDTAREQVGNRGYASGFEVANALIHQDFAVTGSGPMVEIFDDRIEITNPGEPLMDAQRLIDTPPRSRNESLASLMRRIGVCEERGSGWDKVVSQSELYQLPAPLAEVPDGYTRVVRFAPRPLTSMDKTGRVRAIYRRSRRRSGPEVDEIRSHLGR